MNFKKKNGKVFTSKFVGTGPSSYEKRIYRTAVSQSLRNTDLHQPVHTVTLPRREYKIYSVVHFNPFNPYPANVENMVSSE